MKVLRPLSLKAENFCAFYKVSRYHDGLYINIVFMKVYILHIWFINITFGCNMHASLSPTTLRPLITVNGFVISKLSKYVAGKFQRL